MSFGTFNLFNFFQQPNTGSFPRAGTYNIDDVLNGVGHSGTASEQNWPFPYAGTAVPFEIVEGGGTAFRLRLFSDSEIGLRLASINDIISGDIAGNIDSAKISTSLAGGFYPQYNESGSAFVVFSGMISGCPPDHQNNFLMLSGEIIRHGADFALPFLIFSGKAGSCTPDLNSMLTSFSGDFIDVGHDNAQMGVFFSGDFYPMYSDNGNISYGLSNFSIDSNRIRNEADISDKASIHYGLASFLGTRGG